ncbi:MAG: rRNA maturation RNase YbeY [Firmicutes bacterium]|nr:rRNA maturation RNase YbeY [Bacillota bacterium]
MEIEIFNETNEDLEKELEELKTLLINVSKDEGLDNILFNVIIIDNDRIRVLNREYRNIDRETDVISFALEDDKTFNLEEIRVLGDIYISVEKARSQAKEYNHSFKRELSFLAIHGFLHLLGYDHMEKEDEEIMFKKQEEVLSRYEIVR